MLLFFVRPTCKCACLFKQKADLQSVIAIYKCWIVQSYRFLNASRKQRCLDKGHLRPFYDDKCPATLSRGEALHLIRQNFPSPPKSIFSAGCCRPWLEDEEEAAAVGSQKWRQMFLPLLPSRPTQPSLLSLLRCCPNSDIRACSTPPPPYSFALFVSCRNRNSPTFFQGKISGLGLNLD